jgi:hypothetical protein
MKVALIPVIIISLPESANIPYPVRGLESDNINNE